MANLICAKCNKPIDEENLVECPNCWEMYHRECWEETQFCLNCKKFNPDFGLLREEDDTEELHREEESPADEETEVQEQTAEIPVFEAPSSSVANTVLIASLVLLASGIAGGIAFVIQMQFPHLRDVTGVIGGCAIAGVGVALALAVRGLAELVNNSQKNAFYLSELVRKQKEKDE